MAARAKNPAVEQRPASPPSRLEIRMNGKVMFSNPECYDVKLQLDDDALKVTASLQPTLVDVAPPRPPERFGAEANDPRNADTVIQQVHSGSRKEPAAPSSEE